MKNKLLKFFVIIFCGLLILGVWYLKNFQDVKNGHKDNTEESVSNINNNDTIVNNELKNEEKETKEVIPNKNQNITLEKEKSQEQLDNVPQNTTLEKEKNQEQLDNISQNITLDEEINKNVEQPILEQNLNIIIEQPVENTEVEKETDKNDVNFEFEITSLDLDTLKTYKLPILLAFGADGCMPCRTLHPTLVELNNELKGKAIIKFIDVWKYPEEVKDFDFSLIPTQFFYNKEGEVVRSNTGILTKNELINILKECGME